MITKRKNTVSINSLDEHYHYWDLQIKLLLREIGLNRDLAFGDNC